MSTPHEINQARWVNLLIPGGGLILLRQAWLGVVIGLLFTVCLNFALAATFLFPDDIQGWARDVGLLLAGGSYAAAQWRLVLLTRHRRREAAAVTRQQALQEACLCLQGGRHRQALEILQQVADQAEHDLLVAYRLAQVLTATRDVEAALAAWQRVRRLDPHHLYRQEVEVNEQALHWELRGEIPPKR